MRCREVVPMVCVAGLSLLSAAAVSAGNGSWSFSQRVALQSDRPLKLPPRLSLELPVSKGVKYGHAGVILGVAGLDTDHYSVVLERHRAEGGVERLPLVDRALSKGYFFGRVERADGELLLLRYSAGDLLVATATFSRQPRISSRQVANMEVFLADQEDLEGFVPPAAASAALGSRLEASAPAADRARWFIDASAGLNSLGGQRDIKRKHPRRLTGSLVLPGAQTSSVCFRYGSDYVGNWDAVRKIKTKLEVMRLDGGSSRFKSVVAPKTSRLDPIRRFCLPDIDFGAGDRAVWTHRFIGLKKRVTNIGIGVSISPAD